MSCDGADQEILEEIGDHFPEMTIRPAAEIRACFEGAELIEPGMVEARQWRPEEEVPLGPLPLLAGVGRVL
ncbi:SAM-dependent methyltransferase [Spirillospora sp. CA-128828]|uniref:SAM-dependent methyltransferase n=1 Tax=Spirillospora sp. CA-128828 TaxID=3240033 RepID=UPI003D944945